MKVCVIGGGAAGMMAAVTAAGKGHEVVLLEKNEKLGKKLFITGKGRCNLTNACDRQELFKNVTVNSRFLYSAFDAFDNQQTMDFFEEIGLPIKVERGNRVFPASDKSSDVIKVLSEELERRQVNVRLNSVVKEINQENLQHVVCYINGGKTKKEKFDACIVATGGLSYKSTGSDGDGYTFAKKIGHNITPLSPSLVALETEEDFPKRIMGLTLKNVTLTLENSKGKKLYNEIGEMLFTHFGISGPLVLSASAYIAEQKRYDKEIPRLFIDLKPGMSADELDQRLLKDFSKEANKDFRNSLDALLPKTMTEEIVRLSGVDPFKKVNSVTKEERLALVNLLKHLELHVKALRPYEEAVITKGGINVKEIDPKTCESKLCPGLYFVGEVLDLDAFTGGFNLQIAWSTGYIAGNSL